MIYYSLVLAERIFILQESVTCFFPGPLSPTIFVNSLMPGSMLYM
jgi:hypothetical protein